MREIILSAIIAALEPQDFILALWQGGSAAHGYTDEWSDLDIVVVIEDNFIEETFAIVEATLSKISSISFKYRVPEPTWHGHSQTFYQLATASPFLIIDFAVMKRSSQNFFLDIECHGHAVIGFDKANIVTQKHLDKQEHVAKMQARFSHLRHTFNFYQVFVIKEINRGHLAQAIVNYQRMTLSPLVEILGMVYRPYRYDFINLKYFNRDFPVDIIAKVEPLYCINDLADLAKKQQVAAEMFITSLPQVEEKIQQYLELS